MAAPHGCGRRNRDRRLNSLSKTKIKHLHGELCFRRAFPRTLLQHRDVVAELNQFENHLQRHRLCDSGIAGSAVHYRFSFDVATWLAQKAPGAVCIDWEEIEDTEALDELLRHILQPSEEEYFFSGEVSTREWIDAARAGRKGTDFDWLLAQLGDAKVQPYLRQLYDMADLPLTWDLGRDSYSRTRNTFAVDRISPRVELRTRPRHVKKEIQRRLPAISRLSHESGSELIDVAMASLAARHRETYHFNFANPDEVYLADVGEGIAIAVFGLLPEHRFELECTMGFLILSNGVPIGYGGASLLFKQVNTGINIFDEYRGSEAPYLWVQVMRVYHALVGCTRFIANPYQLGDGNSEALHSGAFWFYYRLGYRPVDAGVRRLASAEQAKIKRDRTHRSAAKILRQLASCDMHLTLPGSRQSEFFDEKWLASGSALATGLLASSRGKTRRAVADRVATDLLRKIGIRSSRNWTNTEKIALRAIAPLVAVVEPSAWPVAAKRSLAKILRAKGSKYELAYAKLIANDDYLCMALRDECINAAP